MADRDTTFRSEPETDLLGAPILSEQSFDVTPDSVLNTAADFGMSTLLNQKLSLLRAVATQTGIAGNFPANGRLMTFQYHRYLSLVKSCFQQHRNLLSFFMSKLLVTHCAPLTLVGERKLNNTAAYPLTCSLRVALTN